MVRAPLAETACATTATSASTATGSFLNPA